MDFAEKITEAEKFLENLNEQIKQHTETLSTLHAQRHFTEGRLEALREHHLPIHPPPPINPDPA